MLWNGRANVVALDNEALARPYRLEFRLMAHRITTRRSVLRSPIAKGPWTITNRVAFGGG